MDSKSEGEPGIFDGVTAWFSESVDKCRLKVWGNQLLYYNARSLSF